MENINEVHDVFTDDSNSYIKYEDLLNYLKDKTVKERNDILVKLISMSDKQDIAWIRKSSEFKNLFSKREVIDVKKRVTEIKRVMPSQKEYISDEMGSYKSKISELAKLGFEEFSKKVMSDEYTSREIDFVVLGLEEEIKDYTAISSDDYKTKNISVIRDIEEEIKAIKAKQNLLLNLKNEVERIPLENRDKFKVIFLQKSSGRTYFIEDVQGYTEQYKSFLTLLESLISGEQDNYKPLHGNQRGLNEVRDLTNQTRIVVDRLDKNTFIVIKGLIKKEDTSAFYRSGLDDVTDYYLAHRDEIVNRLCDEEYLKEQEGILDNVIKLLSKK